MHIGLKPLEHQILVITGATGGVGLAVARAAARRGARLVLAGKNGPALSRITSELADRGTRVVGVEADVADPEDARRIAEAAQAAFGGFDTWISTTPTALAGEALSTPAADQRRMFDALYWGAAHGAIEAARHLRRRGGVIVTVGGTLADEALARHAPYGAARGAIEAFVTGLRRELRAENAPIVVTLVKPSAVAADDAPPAPPGAPTYDPDVVARAVLYAAEHHRRTLVVGSGGFAGGRLGAFAPGVARRLAGGLARRRGSLALEAQMHPGTAFSLALATIALAAGLGWALSRRGEPEPRDIQDARYRAWRAARPYRAGRPRHTERPVVH